MNNWEYVNLPVNNPSYPLAPVIFGWYRDPQTLKRKEIKFVGFEPYFYVGENIRVPTYHLVKTDIKKGEVKRENLVKRIELIPRVGSNPPLKKVVTFIPSHVKTLRKMLEVSGYADHVYEADIEFIYRFLIDKKIKTSLLKTEKGFIPIEEDVPSNLKIVFLDIEILAQKKPDPKKLKQREKIICCTIWDNYSKEYHVFYEYSHPLQLPNYGEDVKIHYMLNEKALLTEVRKYLVELDPDVIAGFNIDFDLIALIKTMEQRHKINPDCLSPLKRIKIKRSKKKLGEILVENPRVRILGRSILDLLEMYVQMKKTGLEEMSLEYIAEKENLPVQKILVPDFYETWNKNPELIILRNLTDVKIYVELDKKLNLIKFADELRKITGCRLEDTLSPKKMLDLFMLRMKGERIMPTARARGSKYLGAHVQEPLAGKYEWVIQEDFSALYPNIIMCFNIDPDTFRIPSLAGVEREKLYILDENHAFLKEPEGLIPKMLKTLMNLRAEKKRLQKEALERKDEQAFEMYKLQEDAIKVLNNACFTPGTEVLTPEGIKKIEELKIGDAIFTVSPKTLKIEKDFVVDKQIYFFIGNLVSLKRSNIDLEVTPEHRFLVKQHISQKQKVVEAMNLNSGHYIPIPHGVKSRNRRSFRKIDLSNFLDMEVRKTKKTLKDNFQTSKKIPRVYNTKDFLELLSWYVTEGSITHYPKYNTSRISIAQKTYKDKIRKLLTKMRIPFKEHKWNFVIHSRILANVLEKLCGKGSYEKKMPYWILDLNKEYLEVVWKTLLLGDGDKNRNRYSTVSKNLADFFTILTALLGKSVKRQKEGKIYRITWEENIRGKYLNKGAIKRVPYIGLVYDITAKNNHFILAGKNGIFTMTGQCYGTLGYRFRKGSKETVESVTLIGRKIIQFVINLINSTGRKVIYGDSVLEGTPTIIKRNGKLLVVPIEKVRSGDFVLDENGWNKVIRLIPKKVRKRLFRVSTYDGCVVVTEDHSLVDSNLEKKSPKELKVGSILGKINYNVLKTLVSSNIDKEEAWLLGYFTANGTAGDYRRTCKKACVHFDSKRIELLRRAQSILKKIGFESYIVSYPSNKTKNGIVYRLIIKNPIKSGALEYFKKCYDEKHRKKIPEEIFNAREESIRAFIQGYFKRNNFEERIWETTGSEQVIFGLHLLCKKIGLKSRYSVYVGQQRKKEYLKKIRIVKNKKDKRLHYDHEIKEIKDLGIREARVYDLETLNGHFSAGGILLHNTDSIFFEPFSKDLDNCLKEANEVKKLIEENLEKFLTQFGKNEQPFKIEPAQIYSSFFILEKKKRYAGYVEWDSKRGKDIPYRYNIKGLEAKRSDLSFFGKKLQTQIIQKILQNEKKEEILKFLEEELNKFDTLPLEQIGIPSAIGQPLREYKANSIQKTSAEYSNKYLGTSFDVGSKPKRIYIKEVPKGYPPTYSLCVDANTKLPEGFEIDYPKMMEVTVKKKIEKLLEIVSISWNEIKLKESLRDGKKKKDPFQKTLFEF